MKKLLNEWHTFLLESSLSRLHKHVMDWDCAIISASRKDPNDLSLCIDQKLSLEEKTGTEPKNTNSERTHRLKSALLASGYGVTAVDGSYIENFQTPQAVEVREDSFFVANMVEDPRFVDTIIKLGQKFCQDSVLLIPRGGEGAYLLGTNNGQFPGLGNRIDVGNMHMGEEAEFMTKIRNRPVVFKEELETYSKLTRLERMAVKALAKQVLE